MNLLVQEWIDQKHARLIRARLVFYPLVLLCAAGYAFSFWGNSLLVPLLTGIFASAALVIAYYALLYSCKKTLTLLKQIQCGLLQEEKYVFKSFDGETERDGVRLRRLTVRTTGEESYERTLYALAEAPLPALEAEQSFVGKTYQNILVDIKD